MSVPCLCIWVAVCFFDALLLVILKNDLGRGKNGVSSRESPCCGSRVIHVSLAGSVKIRVCSLPVTLIVCY